MKWSCLKNINDFDIVSPSFDYQSGNLNLEFCLVDKENKNLEKIGKVTIPWAITKNLGRLINNYQRTAKAKKLPPAEFWRNYYEAAKNSKPHTLLEKAVNVT